MGPEGLVAYLSTGMQTLWNTLRVFDRFSRRHHSVGIASIVSPLSTDPLPVEVLPQSFEIDIQQPIPRVRVDVLVINYKRKQLNIDTVEVSHLGVTGTVILERIGSDSGIVIPGQRSRVVSCHRQISDAELRLLRNNSSPAFASGEASVRLCGRLGRKRIERGPFPGLHVRGRLLRGID